MRFLAMLCALSVLLSFGDAAARSNPLDLIPKHELSFGIGWASASEEDVFNIPNDAPASPDVGVSLVYYINLNPHLAVGIHVFGYEDTLHDYRAPLGRGVVASNLDLTAQNVGLRGRWTVARGRLAPYFVAGVSYATGTARSDPAFSQVRFHGYSAAAGGGLSWRIRQKVALSLEGIGSRGQAWWNLRPVEESADKDFDPSMFNVYLSVNILMGELE